MAFDDIYNNPVLAFQHKSFIPTPSVGDYLSGALTGPLIPAINLLKRATADKYTGVRDIPQPQDFSSFGSRVGIEGPSQQQSTTDQILQQLMALQDPSKYMMDDNALRAQAASQAAAQYDPVIAALRNQAKSASARGERNASTVNQMFNELSDNIKGELPGIQNQYQQTMDKSSQQYNQLKQDITNQYANSQQEQEDMYKRLNIQAAAGDVLPQQQRDRDYFVNRANTDAQTQQSALTTERQGAVDYTNMGSQADRNEGVQRKADVLSQLQDLLNQYDAQIGANQAAKAQSTNSLLTQLQQQNRQSAGQQAQQAFNNYIAATNLGRNLNNDEFSRMIQMQKANQVGGVKSLSDVAPYALQLGLPQQSAQRLQSVFSSALANDPSILAGVNEDTGMSLPPEAKAHSIVEAGRAAGLSQQELNALQNMALQYFGRG